ncbi:response regulator [Sulfurimonas sp.]|jgi:two-component system chemotaxis response regulator CheY|uniref:response regulator n=1 Tax=Sulfurimonas sp. TaxID=2022749 RepID=UPI0025F1596A|nr:response regulator [Sulfurimonas sp.]MBT5933733.1 response regulator [Sulfurimonas sp.]
MKLLVVDDAKLIHFMVKKILKEAGIDGIEIQDAFDGNQAADIAKEFKPDLVLLDVVMPEKDGIEALRSIKEDNPDVKVIMLSSMGTSQKVSEALKLGANAFIQKPFDEEELCALFRKEM